MATNSTLLRSFIFKGDSAGMDGFLRSHAADAIFSLGDWEPYTTVQTSAQVRTLHLLLNDKRFSFDDLFVAQALYFSTSQMNRAVLEHTRMKPIVFGYTKSFMEYFHKRYPSRGYEGMAQRYIACYSRVHLCKRRIVTELNKGIAFFLYPALISYSREFKQRYYAPGTGTGFLKSKARFEGLAGTS